jgi:penicillin amidase
VHLHRILKYINIVIAIALAALVGAVYWFAWRPMPETSGSLRTLAGKRVTVTRDALGVPHIQAETIEDALFAQGYVTAQDRLWQMDSLRRFAAGELSEIVGTVALEVDKEARNLRLRRLAEDAAQTLAPEDRAMLAAYARGVNAFLETHRNKLPLEIALLGYQPRPWRVADSVLLGFHMFRNLTTTWKDELLKRNFLSGGEPDKVDMLFPARSGSETQPGSNAWAIAGKLTASGKPILANDMHLEWTIPGIWYMAHLRAPGLNVSGVTLPGAPGVIAGHNERIAWGITNLHYDVQDLYREKFDDRTGRYEFRGQVEQARAEREVILVKGAKPVEMGVWVTRHGPLLVAQEKERLALKWVAAEPGVFQFPFLDINRAKDWKEFTAALARFPGPGSNFVYADVDGNIGYHAAGKLPIRKGYEGDIPVDGASGDFEWQGFIPFDELPVSFNPPGGLIVTGNQNPFPRDYPYPVNGNFASHYRSMQIRQMLSARTGWKPEDMITVQKDVYSGFSHYLARALIAACEERRVSNSLLTSAVALLKPWNGQMEMNQPQPLIVALAFQHLRKSVAEAASQGKGPLYEYQMAPAVLERLLRERPNGWYANWDEELVRAFSDAMEEGQRMQGTTVAKWRYGNYTEFTIAHPVGHRLWFVNRYFDVGPVWMSGASTTVKQTTSRLGPSMRMAADLADWDKSLLNIPIGQSGHVLSSHYKDQWEPYWSGRTFLMQFGKIEGKHVLALTPEQ